LLVNAGQEYAIIIPEKTIRFKFRARGKAKLQCSFESGESDSEYWTVMPGNIFPEEGLYLEGKSLYIQSPYKDNVTVEFLAWKP
jgi:hypothetical protein